MPRAKKNIQVETKIENVEEVKEVSEVEPADSKEISMTKLDKYLNGKTKTLSGLEIKPYISFEEMYAFADNVCDLAFKNGDYNPVMRLMGYNKCLLSYYTNIKIDKLTNDRLAAITYKTELIDFIQDSISGLQYCDISQIIDEMIKYKLDCIMSEKTHELNKIEKHFEDMITSMDSFAEQMKGVDMSAFIENVQKLANKDEKKIVEAVTDNIIDLNAHK